MNWNEAIPPHFHFPTNRQVRASEPDPAPCWKGLRSLSVLRVDFGKKLGILLDYRVQLHSNRVDLFRITVVRCVEQTFQVGSSFRLLGTSG